MESGIAELYDVLHDQSRADHVGQYDVYRILESNRARLLAVFDVGVRNGAARREVESGKIEYNGQRLLLNAEFQRAAVALSEQLNVSEIYCARLLKDVEATHPNAALNARIACAIVQFHNTRYQTARCLLQLFAVPAYAQFRDTLMTAMIDLPGSKRGRLADKVLLEIDNVTSTMAAVANALANATTAASSPYGLAHGTLSLRLENLREERRILGHVLYAIAATRNLTGVEVLRLVEWLSAHALQDDMVPYVFMAALFALDIGEDNTSLCNDKTFIGHATRLFDTKTDWKAPQMRAALTLQWALFLRAVHQKDPASAGEDTIEKAVWDGVLGDGFLCLSAFIDDEQLVAQPEMRRDLLDLLERLVSAVVMHMSPVLRRIRHKQEDVAASEQGRQDIAALFRLVGSLYGALPPDTAQLKYWGVSPIPEDERLAAFIRWAAESRDSATTQAAFDMVAGLSTGREAAALAFNFLASDAGILSWANLFGMLEHLHQHPTAQPNPNEVYLAISFLGIARQVAHHSPAARLALHHHPQFRVLPAMLALVPASVPLELKGALLDTVAAFCAPGAGPQGVELCRTVWGAMERAGVLAGVARELEDVEAPGRVFPSTLALVRLLGALVHTPKELRALDAEPRDTMPPGAPPGPYVAFVVDAVLLRTSQREFNNIADKWAMVDVCLAFVERALASLDPLVLTPLGTEVLARLLSDTPLRRFLLGFVDEGANETPATKGSSKSLLRALRIFHRVLEIQPYFLSLNSAAVGLDEAVSWTPRVVVQLAIYVTRDDQEMVLLAVRIFALLVDSSPWKSGGRLAMVLQGAEESAIIQDGFVRVLRAEDTADAGDDVETFVGAGAQDVDADARPDLTAAIKEATMTLLLHGGGVARFLLGYDARGRLEDPSAAQGRPGCLHVILDALSEGVPRATSSDGHHHAHPILATNLPILAEKYYKLLRNLCDDPSLGDETLRYLRTREDFCARHLRAVPFRVRHAGEDGDGLLVFEDGASVAVDARPATAFLRARAWVMELVALEMHVASATSVPRRLLAILFDDEGPEGMMAVEALRALNVRWVDSIKPEDGVELQALRALDFESCARDDGAGCAVYDVDSLLSLLSTIDPTNAGANKDQVRREMKYVLERAAVENRRRQLEHAKALGYEAWARVVRVALARGGKLVDEDVVCELSLAVCAALASGVGGAGEESLAQTLVALIAALRHGPTDVPSDRLLALARGLLECALALSGVGRGNVYAALIHFLHLIEASEGDAEAGVLAIVDSIVDRLVPTICRDAVDGAAVWKTVAFTLLDALVRLSRKDKRHKVLNSLATSGYLQTFVREIKHGEEELFSVLASDPGTPYPRLFFPALTSCVFADDLNALYIYEAKMALLVRLAQTRAGADEVFKARAISTLASCEFLDARPDADEAYLDDTSFLPSVVARYHQLLVPALQLVNSVLASGGVASASAAKQALSFLLSHRETFLAILRDIPPRVTLAVLGSLQLVVALCSFVVPQVPPAELSGYAGFGGVHAALLAVAGRFLSSRYGSTDARVTDEAEYDMTKARAPGYGVNASVFEVRLYDAVALLRKWSTVYLSAASRSGTGDEILSVLLMTPPGKEADVHPTALASGPTISDSITALNEAVAAVEDGLAEVYDLAVKLNDKDTLSLEEVDEVATTSGSELLPELDLPQRRELAVQELERAHGAAHSRILSSLHMLEMLLLLVCEHLRHWPAHARTALGLGTSSAGPLAGFAQMSTHGITPENGMSDALRRLLAPALSRLEVLELPKELVGADATTRQKFVQAMCRRIAEATADRDGMDEADDEDTS
ncbi:hypothetical protein AURDEDRAFT_184350 [Auricularia subglabra TFB-10046 SS5]|nr:hypothetical protein AURDEDRAFT_184350 [Auricularia subglabra TFB-10046 SS5]